MFIKMRRKKIIVVSLMLVLISCGTKQLSVDTLIYNATIMDVTAGKLIPNQLIGIVGDTISVVAPMSDSAKYRAKAKFDVAGKFVMPGLWDNHVHFRGGENLIAENKKLLPLFLAYGVTSVRDAGGDISSSVMGWKNDIRADNLVGPDIYSSGPKFDGSKPAWSGSIKISQQSQIAPAMDSLQEMGVNYFKVYDGNLTPEMYYALIEEAEKRQVKITGHMPMNASLEKALELGLDGMEHLYYMLQVTSSKKDSILALQEGYGAIAAYIDSYDDSIAKSAFVAIGQGEFYATPTLYIGKVLNQLPLVNHDSDSLLPLIGVGIQETYQRRLLSAMGRDQDAQQYDSKLRAHFVSLVEPMLQAGIIIVAGSDCGPSNSYVYPGEALIGELMMLVEAGLSPQEALKASIVNGPKFLGLSDYYGSVAVDKVANLIVLAQNPLDDIQHIKTLEMVLKGDQVFDKAALNSLLY
jgi:imidazolonepropionase-like amidohydrolase